MTMTEDTKTQELLISSDSHVKIGHDNVKAHLASKFHDAYDKAASGFAQQMSTGAGAVNQAWDTSREARAGHERVPAAEHVAARPHRRRRRGSRRWTSTVSRRKSSTAR